MHTDSAFVIGQAHRDNAKPCQDYALSGQCDGQAWAVVCDGCSTAGRTDVGARMWAQAANVLLGREAPEMLRNPALCRQALAEVAEPLLAPFDFLDGFATVMLLSSDGKTAQALAFGDGVIAARLHDGGMQFWVLEVEGNAPFYPNYHRNPSALAAWRRAYSGASLRVCMNRYDAQGEMVGLNVEMLPAATEGYLLTWDARELADVEALFVCSDGAMTVDGQLPSQTMADLCGIKSPVGSFMQRRMAALSRRWRKPETPGPMDDLAVGALWLGGET